MARRHRGSRCPEDIHIAVFCCAISLREPENTSIIFDAIKHCSAVAISECNDCLKSRAPSVRSVRGEMTLEFNVDIFSLSNHGSKVGFWFCDSLIANVWASVRSPATE